MSEFSPDAVGIAIGVGIWVGWIAASFIRRSRAEINERARSLFPDVLVRFQGPGSGKSNVGRGEPHRKGGGRQR